MKKFLAFATLASVALVGCVNDEQMEMAQEAKKVSFNNPVMSTQTRANVKGEMNEGVTYNTNEDFVVYAKKSSTPLDMSTWSTGTNFWKDGEGLTVTYKNAGDWEHATDTYYWPKDGYLSFAAYSPAVLEDGGSVVYGNGGWVVTDFKVNPTVGEQIDLMVSDPVWNQTEPDTEKAVDINFKHTLSSIVFSVVENDDKHSYKINSVTVEGNIAMTGSMNNSLQWGHNGQTSTTLTKAVNYDVTTIVTEFLNGENAMLLIPQTNIGNVEVTLNITRTADGTNITETYNKTVKFSDFLITGGSNVTEWQQGKRYVYNFTIGGTKKIFFAPTVTNWDVVNLDVEI